MVLKLLWRVTLSQVLESVVRCWAGRIEGVTAVSVIRSIAGGEAGHEEVEIDAAVVLSAAVRRRVPAQVLG